MLHSCESCGVPMMLWKLKEAREVDPGSDGRVVPDHRPGPLYRMQFLRERPVTNLCSKSSPESQQSLMSMRVPVSVHVPKSAQLAPAS